ncbi:MAG: hypothetical protein N3D10_03325 [Candidatus Micrarchaeota archaeon]|nr:hypothetical protein [Candidatus Micrarchaeota archaeon]
MKIKGQASAEYIMLIAVLLIVFLVVIVLFFDLYGQLEAIIQKKNAEYFVDSLAAAAKRVYQQGPDAKELIFLDYSDFEVDKQKSKIENRTICLHLKKFGDVCSRVNFDIEGYFLPTQISGYYLIWNDNRTKIYPATYFYYSKPGFYFNSSPASSGIELTNYGHINLTLNQTLYIQGCSSCTYNESGLSVLEPAKTKIGQLNIANLLPGRYTGYLKIEASNNLNYANQTIILPVTIEIS